LVSSNQVGARFLTRTSGTHSPPGIFRILQHILQLRPQSEHNPAFAYQRFAERLPPFRSPTGYRQLKRTKIIQPDNTAGINDYRNLLCNAKSG
jgi:hypothetical protein